MSLHNQGTAAQPARKQTHGIHELEEMLTDSPTPQSVCTKLAEILGVHSHEIALLRVEKGTLRFIFPAELRSAGIIPITGSAVAARTAASRTSLLSNSFARIKHVSLFESVKLEVPGEGVAEQPPIQKIMSVPVANPDGRALGVLQISRKGLDSSLAGSDFTGQDLKLVERGSSVLARMRFMQEGAPLDETAE